MPWLFKGVDDEKQPSYVMALSAVPLTLATAIATRKSVLAALKGVCLVVDGIVAMWERGRRKELRGPMWLDLADRTLSEEDELV